MDDATYRRIIPHLDMPTPANGQGLILSYCPMHNDGKQGKRPGTVSQPHGRSLSLSPKYGLSCLASNCLPKGDGVAFKKMLDVLGVPSSTVDRPVSVPATRISTEEWFDVEENEYVYGVPSHARLIDTYHYRLPSDALVALKARWEYDDPSSAKGYSKTFKVRRPDQPWKMGLSGPGCEQKCVGGACQCMKGSDMPLFRSEAIDYASADQPVWFVEGEKSVLALESIGQLATCSAGGAGQREFGVALEVLRGHPVLLWPDNDEAGALYIDTVREALQGIATSTSTVDVVKLNLLPKEDVVEYLASGRSLDDVRFLAEEPVPEFARATRLSDVTAEDVKWLWQGRIPLGKLTILDGDPGLGKSTLTLDLAARVTTGRHMPDGSASDLERPAVVVLVSCEDGLADTVRPRFEAAGGVSSMVQCWPPENEPRVAEFPDDAGALEKLIEFHSAKLVIIDPLSAHLGAGINSFKDQDMRRALSPLAQVTTRSGAAIILVRHLNKTAGAPAMQRGGGSIAIIAIARAGLLVAKDPDEPIAGRVLAVTKMNLAMPGPSQSFRLVTADFGQARIDWRGVSTHSADALVAPPAIAGAPSALEDASEFLLDLLNSGPVASSRVFELGKAAGISESALQRMKGALKIKPKKTGAGWSWELPSTAEPA